MRASDLIVELQELINKHGDCYVTYYTESNMDEMDSVDDIEVIPYFETKYFCIK